MRIQRLVVVTVLTATVAFAVFDAEEMLQSLEDVRNITPEIAPRQMQMTIRETTGLTMSLL